MYASLRGTMVNTYFKENVRIITSMVFTILFLVGSTYLWKGLHQNYDLAYSILNDNNNQIILMENIDVCSDLESDKLFGYQFTITSNYDVEKNYNVKIISDHINNEDIHYTIDDSEIMSLNSDKIILNKNILAKDEHNYILKVWLTNDYVENNLNVLIDFE